MPAIGADHEGMSPLRVATILLVEDNPDHAEFALRALKKSDVATQVIWAKDGEEAVEILGQAPFPDLILLDVNLPKLSGHEVLRRVRADDSLRGIPVVMLSTSTSTEDVAASYAAGANSYVSKKGPFKALIEQVTAIRDYWFVVSALPRPTAHTR